LALAIPGKAKYSALALSLPSQRHRHAERLTGKRNAPAPIASLRNGLGQVIDTISGVANPRPEEKLKQGMEDAGRRTGGRVAEQTTRIGQAASETGEEVTEVSQPRYRSAAGTITAKGPRIRAASASPNCSG